MNGVERSAARVVSTDGEGRPIYGGTPADFAVVQAIQELKARGLRVTFYPFILMDVPAPVCGPRAPLSLARPAHAGETARLRAV